MRFPQAQTTIGQAFDDVIHLKEICRTDCEGKHLLENSTDVNGGDINPVSVLGMAGDVNECDEAVAVGDIYGDEIDIKSLASLELEILWTYAFPTVLHSLSDTSAFKDSLVFQVSTSPRIVHKPFNLSRVPSSYSKAVARSDAQT